MQDDDLEITCPCGRVTLIIRNGQADLRTPDKVVLILSEACMICCGCKVEAGE